MRQISNTSSHATTVSGSENWQTIEDDSEPEKDATDAYYEKLRAARGKRFTPDDYQDYPQGGTLKKQKGIQPYAGRPGVDTENCRIVSNSDSNWTDEDAF
jgi:protein regulator of cytokinesis 1